MSKSWLLLSLVLGAVSTARAEEIIAPPLTAPLRPVAASAPAHSPAPVLASGACSGPSCSAAGGAPGCASCLGAGPRPGPFGCLLAWIAYHPLCHGDCVPHHCGCCSGPNAPLYTYFCEGCVEGPGHTASCPCRPGGCGFGLFGCGPRFGGPATGVGVPCCAP